MTLREILARRDAIRTDLRGILTAHPDGAFPDEVRTKDDALEAEADRLTDLEKRQIRLDEMDRLAPGRPLGGAGGTATRPEVRIGEARGTVPEGFDGLILRSQDGTRVPALSAKHRLSDFVTTPQD